MCLKPMYLRGKYIAATSREGCTVHISSKQICQNYISKPALNRLSYPTHVNQQFLSPFHKSARK